VELARLSWKRFLLLLALMVGFLCASEFGSAQEESESSSAESEKALGQVFSGEDAGEPADRQGAEELGEIRVMDERLSVLSRVFPGEKVEIIKRSDFPRVATSLADVLEKSPLAKVLRTGSEGTLTTLSLRGAGANQVVFMIDGVPVNLAGGTPFDLSLLDLGLVSQIELVTGGLGYGSRSVGGVVNVITAGRLADEKREKEGNSLSYGSFETAKFSLGKQRTSASSRSFWMANVFSTGGDFPYRRKDSSRRIRDNNEARRFNLLYAREHWSQRKTEAFTVLSSGLKRGVPGFSEFPTRFAELTESVNTISFSRFVDSEAETGWDKEVKASLTGSYLRFTDPKPALGAEIKSRSGELDFVSELELRKGSGDFASLSFGFSKMMASEFGSPSRAFGKAVVAKSFDVSGSTIGPVAALNLAEGLPTMLSGGVGVEAKASRGIVLSANFGRSFRYPDFSELYFPSQGFIRGNPMLRSERADFLEVSITSRRKDFSAGLTGYLRNQKNGIKFVPVSAYAIAPVNTGKVKVWGIEVFGEAKLSSALALYFSESFTRAKFAGSGIELTQTPRYKFFSELVYEKAGYSFALSHFRESAQSADLFGSIRVPAKQITDAELGLKTRLGTLRFTAHNVFDEPAYDFIDFPLPGRYFEISFHPII